MTLHLVCHGRPLADGELDPAGFDDAWELRESGRLPGDAAWFCAPEPAAVGTAQLLTEGDVGILDDLRAGDRDRVLAVVRRVLDVHAGEDVVLVGDAASWAHVAATLDGGEPDVVVVTPGMLAP